MVYVHDSTVICIVDLSLDLFIAHLSFVSVF